MPRLSRMTMLAIFDIDGTLTRTNAVDDGCFCQALAEALGVGAVDIDWTAAPHITDSGIAAWLASRYRNSILDPAEIALVQRRFHQLLADAFVTTPEQFAPTPGAGELLPRLQANGWHVAMATGGWRISAEFKLRVGGIAWSEVPLATADDASTREEIVACARAHAERRARRSFHRVVSVGDAVWDVRTALAQRLPFVGIGEGEAADHLRAAGAGVVLANFRDLTETLDALARAKVPSPNT